jgi:hypothetical protein
MREFVEDILINKLNGFFLILYGNDHIVLGKIVESLTNFLVGLFVILRVIPKRIRKEW